MYPPGCYNSNDHNYFLGFIFSSTPTQPHVGLVESIHTTFKLSECGCERTLFVKTHEALETVPLGLTTCSIDAYQRGVGQSIISYLFYGDINSALHRQRDFFGGIEINLINIRKFYPGTDMVLKIVCGSDIWNQKD